MRKLDLFDVITTGSAVLAIGVVTAYSFGVDAELVFSRLQRPI